MNIKMNIRMTCFALCVVLVSFCCGYENYSASFQHEYTSDFKNRSYMTSVNCSMCENCRHLELPLQLKVKWNEDKTQKICDNNYTYVYLNNIEYCIKWYKCERNCIKWYLIIFSCKPELWCNVYNIYRYNTILDNREIVTLCYRRSSQISQVTDTAIFVKLTVTTLNTLSILTPTNILATKTYNHASSIASSMSLRMASSMASSISSSMVTSIASSMSSSMSSSMTSSMASCMPSNLNMSLSMASSISSSILPNVILLLVMFCLV